MWRGIHVDSLETGTMNQMQNQQMKATNLNLQSNYQINDILNGLQLIRQACVSCMWCKTGRSVRRTKETMNITRTNLLTSDHFKASRWCEEWTYTSMHAHNIGIKHKQLIERVKFIMYRQTTKTHWFESHTILHSPSRFNYYAADIIDNRSQITVD